MGEEIINETWTGGRARNMGKKNYTGIEGARKDLDIAADVTERRWE